MRRQRQDLRLKIVRITLIGLWCLVALQCGRFGWSVVSAYFAETDLGQLSTYVREMDEWFDEIETEAARGSDRIDRGLDVTIPVELDVTAATEELLAEFSRHPVDAFQYAPQESVPWSGPTIDGLLVMRDPFSVNFKCDYRTLGDIAMGLENLDRVFCIRQMNLGLEREGILQVNLVLETLRRTPGLGETQ